MQKSFVNSKWRCLLVVNPTVFCAQCPVALTRTKFESLRLVHRNDASLIDVVSVDVHILASPFLPSTHIYIGSILTQVLSKSMEQVAHVNLWN